MFSRNVLRAVLLGGCGVYFVACSQEPGAPEKPPTPGQTDFVSHVLGSGPGREAATDGGLSVAEDAAGSGAQAGQAPSKENAGENGAGEAERAISEADILKQDGDRLYALSRYSGLSVIDMKDPSALRLLGTHRTSGMPFEMYVEGERAYVMYNGWGRYEANDDGYFNWVTSSRIQALDLSDAKDIRVLGEKDMPGELSDSRKVGDVLYLVTAEDGYCWRCENSANTRVASFNVADPDEFQFIDELRISEVSGYLSKRSISVTQERIYISGWDFSGTQAGVIDVVDISEPSGELVAGAEIAIAGPIESRWQIDEFEGVLRVISQPGGWNTSSPPVVETFQVASSHEFTRLGSLQMVLPRPEDLRSVRFDGERAYAITFERTDPLFTLDLSEPSEPVQVGELEIPGWVYHMEPRGDRIYALGFDDDQQAGGALHVSLFDVSEMSEPRQLARVNFGGRWAQFAEDQDRIHKAFNIMSDEGLILVPFSGWDYDEEGDAFECSRGEYLSGIQLVDMSRDTLALRGVAPQVGEARRGFLANDALFGISDNAVQTFDISDRDAPAKLGELELARNIDSVKVVGDNLLRFGQDWWTGKTTLDFAARKEAAQAEPLGDLDLSAYSVQNESCEGYSHWESGVLVHGDYAYVPRRSYQYGNKLMRDGEEETSDVARQNLENITFYIVSLKDTTDLKLVGRFSIWTDTDDENLTGIIKTDSAILVGRQVDTYLESKNGYERKSSLSYDVFSLANPEKPERVSSLDVPADLANGGWGYNLSGCSIDIGWGWWGGSYSGNRQALVSGDLVASQHQVPLDDDSGRVRYYVDLIDVSNPAEPVLRPPVNIPGALIDFDQETKRLITIDYLVTDKPARTWEECVTGNGNWNFLEEERLCRGYRRVVNTLELSAEEARLLDSLAIDDEDNFAGTVAASNNRVFAQFHSDGGESTGMVRSFAVGSSGKLEALGEVALDVPSWGQLVARDNRAFLSAHGQLTVVDTQDKKAVRKTKHEMGGYYCGSLEVAGDTAYCALGAQGAQAFPLD